MLLNENEVEYKNILIDNNLMRNTYNDHGMYSKSHTIMI